MSTDLEHALNGGQPEEVETPEAEVVEEPVTEPTETAEAEAETPPEAPAEPEENPLEVELRGIKAALSEARKEVRELKDSQPRPAPPPPPDMYEDPEGYQRYQTATVEQMQQTLRLDMSEEMARQAHGDDVVDAAFEALKASGDKAATQAIMAERSPYNALVKWHKQQKVVSEIGSDPDAWMAKKEAEILAKVEARLVAEQAKATASQPAPSMANVTGTGGGPKTTWTGPTPLDDILS